MRIAMSVVWLAFAVGFFQLGRMHAAEARREIEEFAVLPETVEFAAGGFHLEVDVANSPLGEPLRELAQRVNQHVEQQVEPLRESSRRAAVGFHLASAAALLCMLLVWRRARPAPAARSPEPFA